MWTEPEFRTSLHLLPSFVEELLRPMDAPVAPRVDESTFLARLVQ